MVAFLSLWKTGELSKVCLTSCHVTAYLCVLSLFFFFNLSVSSFVTLHLSCLSLCCPCPNSLKLICFSPGLSVSHLLFCFDSFQFYVCCVRFCFFLSSYSNSIQLCSLVFLLSLITWSVYTVLSSLLCSPLSCVFHLGGLLYDTFHLDNLHLAHIFLFLQVFNNKAVFEF